jgi:hypothetical protein
VKNYLNENEFPINVNNLICVTVLPLGKPETIYGMCFEGFIEQNLKY